MRAAEGGHRIALVTGGSRGIGRAISVALARRGGRVAINYRSDADGAKQTLLEVEQAGGEGLCVQADVTSARQVARCFDDIQSEWGPVSILVNNAGIRRDSLALTMSDEDWDAVLRANLTSAFVCTKRALRSMLDDRWGRIVSISSVAGISGSPGQANYSAAKAGLIGFTKTLAREVARKGITANVVAPGPVRTDMLGDLSERALSALIEQVPARRAVEPAEVAEAVAYLCSEEAAAVTGVVLPVDGGMTT